MPSRVLTCGLCGESETLPEGDWNEVQSPLADDWLNQHADTRHDGEVGPHSIDPNPMRD
jgi:hypothetical protein